MLKLYLHLNIISSPLWLLLYKELLQSSCLIIAHCDSTKKSSDAFEVITQVLLPQVRLTLKAGSWYTMISFIHVISFISHMFYIHTSLPPHLSLGLRNRKWKTFETDLQKWFDSCVALWSIFLSIMVTWYLF